MNHKQHQASWITLIGVTLMFVTAWVHSHTTGWRTQWSDPDAMAGGRIVSANGQIYYQHCSLNAERLPAALADQLRDPRQMPAGFYVGSNPDGKPTVIAIANYPIPFTNPSPRQFIGMHDQTIYHNTTEQESWYSSATEFLIAYWLATLLPALLLMSQCRKWLLRKRQPTTMGEQMADAPIAED